MEMACLGAAGSQSPDPGRPACRQCPVAAGCLVAALPASNPHRPCCWRKLEAGAVLYRAGEALSAIYVIRSGSFKSRLVDDNGLERIAGIHLSGEVLGGEAIASGRHICSLSALEDSVACIFPMPVLAELCRAVPAVQRWFHRVLGRQVVAASRDIALLGRRNAEARLAAFLLALSRRHEAIGHAPGDFPLRLTRREIGSHLGMSAATVSRVFVRLGKAGVASTCGQRVRLLDIPALQRCASGRPEECGCPAAKDFHPRRAQITRRNKDANRRTTGNSSHSPGAG